MLLLASCSNAEQPTPSIAVPAPAAPSTIAPTAQETTAGKSSVARYDGYGDMRLGMDEAAFDAAWAGELEGRPQSGSDCFYKTPKWVKSPSDFSFMFEHGHFVRYNVGTVKEVAPGGGKVGMSTVQIQSLYGARIKEQPHKYLNGGKYLRIRAPSGDGVLLFETDAGGKVTGWHVGVPPQVDYVEGCS